MKVRTDFVSNSSSSSFIVVRNTGPYEKLGVRANGRIRLPSPEIGTDNFGWETCVYSSVGAKINWTANILLSMRRLERSVAETKAKGEEPSKYDVGVKHFGRFDEFSKRFLSFLKSEFGLDAELMDGELCDQESFEYGIDHQSNFVETPSNADMLETDEKLRDFICNADSHIDNSNDNGGRDEDEWY